MKGDPPADDELLAVILGRSGTLRAPTIVSGGNMVVGFNGEALSEALAL